MPFLGASVSTVKKYPPFRRHLRKGSTAGFSAFSKIHVLELHFCICTHAKCFVYVSGQIKEYLK